MTTLNVKWGKEKLSVEANTDEPPLLLKSQLFAMTGVTPERQKIVIKGRTLGDDSWNGITLTQGMLIMMMGSADAIPQAPAPSADGAEAEKGTAKAAALPPGLKNLGNTCYMNSVIQSLKASITIPVLRDSLSSFDVPSGQVQPAQRITSAMKSVFKDLSRTSNGPDDAGLPIMMLQTLHSVLPQFSTRSPQGQLMQQDANECFTEVQRFLLDGLKSSAPNATLPSEYFRGRYAVSLKNKESEEEAEQKTTEDFFQLSCFLSAEVKYIQTGIREKMTEEIEKMSPVLGREAKYERKALVDRLPAYLSIQMVRFFFKQQATVNAKILKDIKFPLTLDLFDICTPELQTKLIENRDAFKAMEDAKLERMRAAKLEGSDGKAAEESIEKEENALPFSFPDDEGSNNSGFYDLQAVITHKGRSSDSGHYVAWVRLKGDQWAMCDDDEVHAVNSEQILKLSGGGDWHCAYVLVYGPRRAYKIDPLETAAPPVSNDVAEPMATD